MMTQQCVVLAGGLGSRLGELTRDVPKPLLPVGGAPFLETLLREAARRGFDDIVLLVGYRSEAVADYLQRSGLARELGVAIRVSMERTPLGTAGALINARPLLAPSFLLLNGDTWFDFNWLDLVARAERTSASGALAMRRVAHPARYETILADGHVIRAIKGRDDRLESGLINGGVYWLRKDAVGDMSTPCSLEAQVLPNLCTGGSLAGWAYDGFFIDIGVPESYAMAQSTVPGQRRRPAAFLDRDGVLNVDTGYLHRKEDLTWIDGAKEAVKWLNDRGYYVFVVTNQAGIGHGYYGEDEFHALRHWIEGELREGGASIDDWRFSPYHPEARIERYRAAHAWRKPNPGMINDIFASWPIDRASSFLVGDKHTDVEAADAAGVRGFLYQGGNLLEFIRGIVEHPA